MYGRNQFEFRPNTSTLHAHISIQEFITVKLDDSHVKDVLIVSFDMSKAFDKLDHAALVRTLNNSNLPEDFVSWCKSYLIYRKQRVVLNFSTKGCTSSVTSGVPQGVVLAPFLFAAHIGTLVPQHPSVHMTKYADLKYCDYSANSLMLTPFHRKKSTTSRPAVNRKWSGIESK